MTRAPSRQQELCEPLTLQRGALAALIDHYQSTSVSFTIVTAGLPGWPTPEIKNENQSPKPLHR